VRTGAKSSIGTFVFTKKGQVIRFTVPSEKSKVQRTDGKDTEQYVTHAVIQLHILLEILSVVSTISRLIAKHP
jgi:hypothetical protein